MKSDKDVTKIKRVTFFFLRHSVYAKLLLFLSSFCLEQMKILTLVLVTL